jgi:hypothetical protein
MNKYKAIKTTVNNITFDSRAEANRYLTLKLLEKANYISDLKCQVPFTLFEKSPYGRSLNYIADFSYVENNNLIVEYVKSKATITPLYKLKKRILAEKYNIIIKEVLNC